MYDEENMLPVQREIYEISSEEIRDWIKNNEGYGETNATTVSSIEESKNGEESCIHKIIDLRPEENEAIEVIGKENEGLKNYVEVRKHSEDGMVNNYEGWIKYTGQRVEEVVSFFEEKLT
ncbi:MAG: hypothetical protein ACLFQ8_01860 [Candidatus Aenigmatarchaeota archaeon]